MSRVAPPYVQGVIVSQIGLINTNFTFLSLKMRTWHFTISSTNETYVQKFSGGEAVGHGQERESYVTYVRVSARMLSGKWWMEVSTYEKHM
jgi:hypothetical protein